MHKTAQEIRAKKKIENEAEKLRIEDLKQKDSVAYLGNLYERRRIIIEKMNERARLKEEIGKRGSKTAQRRMQVLAELGIEERNNVTTGDNFGQDDDDWDVYREIQKDGLSEDEEEEQGNLNELEEQIAGMDPKFGLLMYNSTKMPSEEDFQVTLQTDRYRGSEILFQPSIVGLESEGITEILEHTLNYFDGESQIRQLLLDFVLLSGGNTLTPNFDLRIKQELRMLTPVGTPINVVRALDAQLDSWKGARLFVQSESGRLQEYSISKAQYEECGHHYLKENLCSNYLYGQKPPSLKSAVS